MKNFSKNIILWLVIGIIIGFSLSVGLGIAFFFIVSVIEFLILYFAGLFCGLTIVPINPDLSSREMKYIIEDSNSKFIFYNHTLESKIISIKPSTESKIAPL